MDSQEYFQLIDSSTQEVIAIAQQAKAKGFDPVPKVEIPIATSLAEKSVGLISVVYPQLADSGAVERILELEKEFGPLEMSVSLKIAEEIARETFCTFKDRLQAIDAGIRVGFAYTTLGVVSSPIEGFTGLKVGKTGKGEDYLIAYFSGPIRSAGTTAGCVVLMIIDYLRETFGFARYDPSEDEVKRYVTENYDYHERVTNLQYLPTEEEIAFLAQHLPIQIAGEPTEQREVSNFKDLARVETNFIRGGMCLIFSEGLAQKAQKGLRLLKRAQERGFIATGWNFLDDYIALHKKREKGTSDTSPTYIKDLVAGRPVYSHPSRSGGFRFRYGLSRTNGFSATSVHPATMAISDSFISFGTQLKIEKPTKGCAVSSCDSIDGPIVKLLDGSVKKVSSYEEGIKLYPSVAEILYFGDLLVPFGDVANRNFELLKPGYVEEWWYLQLAKVAPDVAAHVSSVDFTSAVQLSALYGVPLHPGYIYYWTQIQYDELKALIDWFAHGSVVEGKLLLPYSKDERERFQKGKRALELIGCQHSVSLEHVIIAPSEFEPLSFQLGADSKNFVTSIESIISRMPEEAETLGFIQSVSPALVKDKAGTFIGARMGRPEKSKLRKLTGNPHAIFPVGKEGGRLRSFISAMEKGSVQSDFPLYQCSVCSKRGVYPQCIWCKGAASKLYYCRTCDSISAEPCDQHESQDFTRQSIDIGDYYHHARKLIGMHPEELSLVKGIRGTSSKDHSCEHLAKGLLRARHGLCVNKDGTIRYDMTEMPLTFFKPFEIGTSVQRLKNLGYSHDVKGEVLESDTQIVELKPHDIVLPSCPESPDERADDVFLRVAKFIDDELEHLYGLPRYYRAEKKSDLIGALFVCIAPHICTATVGRLIGFSKTQSLLASPYMHAAMRRDCDGDEAAVMLLSDMLINFSRKFLPAHRGGTQDAPLVLNTKISAGEVDDQILDFELGPYPLELYELAEQGKHSSEVKVETVKTRIKTGKDPFVGKTFTHDTFDLNSGVVNSSYKSLPTMDAKVASMMGLCKKLRAVDVSDVARLTIERHFMRDIRGNLRKFSMQVFRCVDCNQKFRRVPLTGKCTCGGKIIFTITEGSIVKYLAPALYLARTYNVQPYLLECLEIVERDIQSIFGKEKEKQEALQKWF